MVNRSIVSILQLLPSNLKLEIFVLLCLIIIGSVSEIVGIGFVMPLVYVITDPKKFQYISCVRQEDCNYLINFISGNLYLLPIVFVLTILIAGILRVKIARSQANFSNNVGIFLSRSVLENELDRDYEEICLKSSSDGLANTLIGRINTIVNGVVLSVLNIVTAIVLLLIACMVLIAVDPLILAGSILLIGGPYVLLILAFKKKFTELGESQTKHDQLQIKEINKIHNGIRDVVLDHSQELLIQNYVKLLVKIKDAKVRFITISSAARPAIEFFAVTLIVLYATINLDSENGIERVAILATAAFATQRFLPIIQQGYMGMVNIHASMAALNNVLYKINCRFKPIVYSGFGKITFNKEIVLIGVEFQYGDGKPIFTDLNLKICKGTWFGIKGKSGVGKSTLQDILLGLLYPSRGSFTVDDILVNSTNNKGWQLNIAHVPQNVFLFGDSILNNITFGNKNKYSINDVMNVMQIVCLEDLVNSYKDGLNYNIGENGVNLSGGQRQRLGIARALLKKRSVLFLDEATNALDTKTEYTVLSNIKKYYPEMTVILISHNDNVLRFCDDICDLTLRV